MPEVWGTMGRANEIAPKKRVARGRTKECIFSKGMWGVSVDGGDEIEKQELAKRQKMTGSQ